MNATEAKSKLAELEAKYDAQFGNQDWVHYDLTDEEHSEIIDLQEIVRTESRLQLNQHRNEVINEGHK